MHTDLHVHTLPGICLPAHNSTTAHGTGTLKTPHQNQKAVLLFQNSFVAQTGISLCDLVLQNQGSQDKNGAGTSFRAKSKTNESGSLISTSAKRQCSVWYMVHVHSGATLIFHGATGFKFLMNLKSTDIKSSRHQDQCELQLRRACFCQHLFVCLPVRLFAV